jgi:hypothetical protein
MEPRASEKRMWRALLRTRSRRQEQTDEMQKSAKSFDSLAALWRDVSLFAAAFAYFAGWTYIRSYYREFEIDPNLLDIAINNYFVYAFFAIFTSWGIALVLTLLILATLVSRFGGGRIGQTAVLIAFAFGLFHVSRTVGSQDGRALRSRFQQLPEVKFVLKDTALEQRLTTQQDWVGTSFLITATKDKYLVLVQKPPDPQFPDRWPAATTLVVPASEAIAGIQVKDVQK